MLPITTYVGSNAGSGIIRFTTDADLQFGDLMVVGGKLVFNGLSLPVGWEHFPGSPTSGSARAYFAYKVAGPGDVEADIDFVSGTGSGTYVSRMATFRPAAGGEFRAKPYSGISFRNWTVYSWASVGGVVGANDGSFAVVLEVCSPSTCPYEMYESNPPEHPWVPIFNGNSGASTQATMEMRYKDIDRDIYSGAAAYRVSFGTFPQTRTHSQWMVALEEYVPDPEDIVAEPYARQMPQLLPPAPWTQDPDSILQRTLRAAARELGRAAGRAQDLIVEATPTLGDELLEDYEADLGLQANGTDAERRNAIVTKLVTLQRVRPADFKVALAPHFGQAIDDVALIERTAADAATMGDESEIFRFFAYRDPTDPGSYDLDAAQDAIDSLAPSHTRGYAIESIDFLCDDTYSLCDRDILGV